MKELLFEMNFDQGAIQFMKLAETFKIESAKIQQAHQDFFNGKSIHDFVKVEYKFTGVGFLYMAIEMPTEIKEKLIGLFKFSFG